MLKRRSYNGVSLTLLIVYTIILFIFNKQIHFGYISVKRYISGVDGFFVSDNYEFLLFYMLFLIFLDVVPLAIVNSSDYFKLKKRLRYDKYAEASYVIYGNKKWILYPALLLVLFITLFTIISSYAVLTDSDIKTRSFLFLGVSRNYSDIESIDCNTQWVYKSTDPVINVKFADNHTLDIGRACIHDIDKIKLILDKCSPLILKKVSKEFITYLNDQEKLFYTQKFKVY
ncbi:MAG TPA: hypothetical protein VIK78_11250 [Ruminiclostridium sp.]